MRDRLTYTNVLCLTGLFLTSLFRKEKGLKRELMKPVDLREDSKEVPRPRRVPESTKAAPLKSVEAGEDQDIERPIVGMSHMDGWIVLRGFRDVRTS